MPGTPAAPAVNAPNDRKVAFGAGRKTQDRSVHGVKREVVTVRAGAFGRTRTTVAWLSEVVVPAHNESLGLVPTLQDIKAQLGAGDRLIVVADNCTDDTAEVAVASGAEVIVRND